jgi:hypothetical protein
MAPGNDVGVMLILGLDPRMMAYMRWFDYCVGIPLSPGDVIVFDHRREHGLSESHDPDMSDKDGDSAVAPCIPTMSRFYYNMPSKAAAEEWIAMKKERLQYRKV